MEILFPQPVKKCLYLFIYLFLIGMMGSLHAQEQLGKPFITNYSYQDYDGAAINCWALEDKRGIMYFANGIGAMQYDGVNWNIIRTGAGSRTQPVSPTSFTSP